MRNAISTTSMYPIRAAGHVLWYEPAHRLLCTTTHALQLTPTEDHLWQALIGQRHCLPTPDGTLLLGYRDKAALCQILSPFSRQGGLHRHLRRLGSKLTIFNLALCRCARGYLLYSEPVAS